MEEKVIEEHTMLDELTDTQRRMRAIRNADMRQVIREELPVIIREEMQTFFKPFVDIIKYAGSLFPKDKK